MTARAVVADARHALYGPSSADRWIFCVASIAMMIGRPSGPNKYSAHGSFAHAIAAFCLTNDVEPSDMVGVESSEFADELAPDIDAGFEFVLDEPDAAAITEYTQAIRDAYAEFAAVAAPGDAPPLLWIETRVKLSDALGIEDQFGTSDATLYCPTDAHLSVHDLKFGVGERVDAPENWQLILYALGALLMLRELGHPVATVRLTIHQPRLHHRSSVEYTADDILEFGAYASERAQRAETLRITGLVDASGADLTADDDWHADAKTCRWCTAFAHCERAGNEVRAAMDIAEIEFSMLTLAQANAAAYRVTEPGNPDAAARAARMSMLLHKVAFVEMWAHNVRTEGLRMLHAGEPLPDWKLVEGRRGPRKWLDEQLVARVLDALGLAAYQIYSPGALRSPTQIEALIKAALIDNPRAFSPGDIAELYSLIDRKPGAPALATSSDPRPAYAPVDFDSLITPLDDET